MGFLCSARDLRPHHLASLFPVVIAIGAHPALFSRIPELPKRAAQPAAAFYVVCDLHLHQIDYNVRRLFFFAGNAAPGVGPSWFVFALVAASCALLH
jgi:hypothetical protein